MGIEPERAGQIAHLDGADERAVLLEQHEAIFFAVADPDQAGFGIYRDRVGTIEATLSDMVSKPLVDEPTLSVQMNDARGALIVCGIRGIDIGGAFIAMPFGDENVAIRTYRHIQGLP